MALTRVQATTAADSGQSSSGATQTTATFPSATTSGNFLFFACAGDKDAGVWTGPGGWTPLINLTEASVSLWVGWKIADGTETAVTIQRSIASSSGDQAFVAEYSSDQSGAWAILGSASVNSDGSSVLARSSGTTAAIANPGGAVAFFAMDSGSSGPGAPSYTNSFTNIKQYPSTGRGSLAVAERFGIAASTEVETTETHTGSGDQKSGSVVVFEKISAAVADAAPQMPRRLAALMQL